MELGASPESPSSSISEFNDDTSPPSQYKRKEQQCRIPGMFSSIMAVRLAINPHYASAKQMTEAWISRIMKADEKWVIKNSKTDLAYLSATWALTCDEDKLRVLIDWNHWIFLFDDQFDEGHLKDNYAVAKKEIDSTIGIMKGTQLQFQPEDNPIRYVFQGIWNRVMEKSSANFQHHWKEMHRKYFNGLLTQIQVMQDQRALNRDVHQYMEMRRETIGAFCGVAMVQWCEGVDLPRDIIAHASLQQCIGVATEIMILSNDIVSYKKDLALGVDHNLIMLLTKQGLSTQEAIDRIGSMLSDCYKRWYTTLADLPVWGENIDRQVLHFVDVCRNMALGNLHWSFESGRYFGAAGEPIRKTRVLSIPCY